MNQRKNKTVKIDTQKQWGDFLGILLEKLDGRFLDKLLSSYVLLGQLNE